jgi:hypothetical protein
VSEQTPSTNNNPNNNTEPNKRDDKLHETQKIIQEGIDKKYYQIKKCFDENDLNDKTIIQTFQNIAADLEEYFRISYDNPALQISMICEYMIKACKARGFTQNQYEYVYDALSAPQYQKYKRHLDLSSLHSLTPSRKRKEDSSARFELFKKHMKKAYELINEIGVIERDDHQEAWEVAMDLVNTYQKKLEESKIPIAKSTQQDFYESGSDESKKRVTYPETKPARTVLVEAIERYSKIWQKVAKIVEDEGEFHLGTGTKMLEDEQIRKIAAGFDTVSELLDPVLDRKWRMDHLHWFNIINVANEWFKHTGATASKVQDFYGRWRSITREHVGARKDNMPPFFNKVIEMMPHYFLFFSVWMSNVRIKQGAEFSIDLGPKLSEQSMR